MQNNDYRARIARAIELNQLDSALLDIEKLVDRVFCEPLNVCEIFGDRFLDDMCQRIGQMSMAKVQTQALAPAPDTTDATPRIVFIASKLQASGGHTAVLADIAKLSGMPATILITRIGGITDLRTVAHRFLDIPNITFEFVPRGSRLSRVEWIQMRILELKPVTVWLFNHHQDSVAVAAVQPDQGYLLKYLHHGDHHLCLGVFLDHGEHYDPHPMGYRNCREILSITRNKYLPMVARDIGPITAKRQSAGEQPFVTCTAAGKNKIEVAYWLSYADVIPAVLRQTKGTHIHIGRLSVGFRLRMWLNLSLAKVPANSFVYIPHVDSVWKAVKDNDVDLYISSFPYAGARTLIEVMGAGIPVAMHSHSFNRFLSILDMAPDGVFVWRYPSQLFMFLAKQSRQTLACRGTKARIQFEKYHSEPLLVQSLSDFVVDDILPPGGIEHTVDCLQKALTVADNLSFINLIKVFFLRSIRKTKTLLG